MGRPEKIAELHDAIQGDNPTPEDHCEYCEIAERVMDYLESGGCQNEVQS